MSETSGPIVASELAIDLSCSEVISYAATYNARPFIWGLSIRSTSGRTFTDVDVTVSLSSLGDQLAEPWRMRAASIGPAGIEWSIGDFESFQPSAGALAEQRELKWGEISVTVEQAGDRLGGVARRVSILAASGWVAGRPMVETAPILGAFVQPHERALASVLEGARTVLSSRGSDPSLEGYQGESDERVDEIVGAIYDAVRSRGLGYIDPPAGWDLQRNPQTRGQRVRLSSEVLGEGFATCLDSTVLMASLVEAVGLRPVLILIPGHALVGYWRRPAESMGDEVDAAFRQPTVALSEAMSFIDAGLLVPVETTTLCTGPLSATFADARRAALGRLQGPMVSADLARVGDGGVSVVVDVAAVRHRGRARPLPVRVVADDGTVAVVEYRPQEFTFDMIRKAVGAASASAAGVGSTVPLRIQRWQNSLLDLSRRNPLLNYRFPERSSVSLFVPADGLGPLEDLLQSAQSVRLLPAPTLSSGAPVSLTTLKTTPAQLDEQFARTLVAEKAVCTQVPAEVFSQRLRRMQTNARSVIDESGSNGLYLAIGSVAWRTKDRAVEDRAPLILIPVNLKASNRYRDFALELDSTSTVTPNFSLAERLKQEFDLDLPKLVEPELDGAGIDIDGLIAYVRAEFLKAGLADFRVDATCTLGFFDFSTYRLWKDLEAHWPRFVEHSPLVRHLVETPTETFVDPVAQDEDDASGLDDFAASLPVLADGSQAKAVLDAMNGHTFVLQGPPGSGKSQTITNLLARALHAGKRVLFVAEKPGALGVVRDRLAEVGLGSFGLNLHDKGMRPADVRRQLSDALDAGALPDRIGFESAQRDIDRAIDPLRRYPARLHAQGRLGESAYSARDKLLALTVEAALPVPPAFVSTTPIEAVADLRRRFRDARDVATTAGSARSNPWSLGRIGSADLSAELRESIDGAVKSAATAVAAIGQHPAAGVFLAGVESLDELIGVALLSERQPDLATVDLAASEAATQGRRHVRDTIHGFAVERLFPGATVRTLEAPVGELRASAQTALASFFIGRRKRVLAVADRVQEFLTPGSTLTAETLLTAIGDAERLQQQTHEYLEYMRRIPGLVLPPSVNLLVDAERETILAQIARLDADVALAASDGSVARERLRTLLGAGSAAAQPIGLLGASLAGLVRDVRATPDTLRLWLSGRELASAILATVPLWSADATEREHLQLRRWAALRDLLGPVEDAGLGDSAELVASGAVAPADAELAFERGLLTTILRRQLDDEGLDAFDGAQQDAYVRAYTAAAAELRRLSPGVLAEDMISGRGFQAGATVGAVGELRRELGKQRGFKPIRRLLRDHWSVISRITPLVLAVPDALVRFVDGDLEPFDLVVFDEASQIRVAHSVGALGRGRAAVVVGDSKQMPPTSVAQVGIASEDEPGEEIADAPVLDEESILTECLRAWLPETYLTWHYRSEDETLIAFSNATYYEGRLNTLPAPNASTEAKGLSFVKVDGRFVRQTAGAGADRGTNRAEAEAIVAEVVRRVHDPVQSAHSIGVVTLNKPQQELVRSLLFATEDDAVLAALSQEQTHEPILVWNLETVQGHERDVILLSIAFSKDESGKLSRNFGPLIYTGGERRLNVAVTRARRQVVVYCSFEPEDLRAEGMSEGLQQLAEYLRIARYGPQAAGATGSAPLGPPDRHREQIASALRSRGLRVATEVGLSAFKVDIAASFAAPAESWSVGVLTDGAPWRARPTVGDRDSLPLSLLVNRMGWPAVTRVWTPDWLRDAEGAADAIEALVRDAESAERAKATSSVASPPSDSGAAPAPAPERLASSSTFASQPAPAIASTGASPQFADVPEWRPWSPREYGPDFVLEQLWDEGTRAYLQEVVRDIIRVEGPVRADRAARHLGRMHGLERVREARVTALTEALDSSFVVSEDRFYFLPDDGPSRYARWSRGGLDPRALDEISLVEVSNAMAAIARIGLGASREELITSAAAVLGFQRVTAGARERLNGGVDEGLRRGVLREENGYVVAV